jgi:hypothetical protein
MENAPFRRSSYCTDAHGCVAVSLGRETVRVRDDSESDGPVLTFDARAWAEFVATMKADGFVR